MSTQRDIEEARRKAKAVGQAHTVKEYLVHDAIAAKGVDSERAWQMTMSLPPKSRGRRPKR